MEGSGNSNGDEASGGWGNRGQLHSQARCLHMDVNPSEAYVDVMY